MPPVSTIVPAAPSAKWPSIATDSTDGSQACQLPGSLHSAQTARAEAVVIAVRVYSKVTAGNLSRPDIAEIWSSSQSRDSRRPVAIIARYAGAGRVRAAAAAPCGAVKVSSGKPSRSPTATRVS